MRWLDVSERLGGWSTLGRKGDCEVVCVSEVSSVLR